MKRLCNISRFLIGAYAVLVLGCAKHQDAPIERTTVGNGGNDVAVNFLADADAILSHIETSYSATRYATKRGIDLVKLRKLVSATDTPVSVVDKSMAGVRNGKLFLDEEKWKEIYFLGRAKTSVILEELLKFIGRNPDKEVIDQLVTYMNPTAVKQSPNFPGTIQMVGPYCGAKEILVTFDPSDKTISVTFDFSRFGYLDSLVASHALTAETLGRRECKIRIPVLPEWKVSRFSADISTYASTPTSADVSVSIQADTQPTQEYRQTLSLEDRVVNSFELNESSFLSSTVLSPSSPQEEGFLMLGVTTQAHGSQHYMVVNPSQVRLNLK